MKSFCRFLTFLLCLGFVCLHAKEPKKAAPQKFSPEVLAALKAPEKVTLYSIEPEERVLPGDESLLRYKVLGHVELQAKEKAVAIGEFRKAVEHWNGWIANCFEPRHALQVVSGGHTYDLVLCFSCNGMSLARDGEGIQSYGASGSPEVVNAILKKAGIPLSPTDAERKASARERWLNTMPKSIRSAWTEETWKQEPPDIGPFRPLIAEEFPDVRQRALVLYGWFGSGSGQWMGYPWHETVALNLLLEIPKDELVAAAMTEDLTASQLEGAARVFDNYEFSRKYPGALKSLPESLRKKLLKHCLESPYESVFHQAERDFGTE